MPTRLCEARPPLLMAQITDLAAQHGLGEESRGIGFADLECPGDVLYEDHLTPSANEVGDLVPATGAWRVVVGQMDRSSQPQVVAEFDYAIPEKNAVATVAAPLSPQRDALDRLPQRERQLLLVRLRQAFQGLIDAGHDLDGFRRRRLAAAGLLESLLSRGA